MIQNIDFASNDYENPMNKYKILQTIGDGTYGSVQKAINTLTKQLVAIKRMKKKFFKWEAVAMLKQIKALITISHPNIVRLHQVIRRSDNQNLLLVFQFLDANVYQLMKSRKRIFTQPQIRNIIYQTLQGLAYMHSKNLFHRDMKPQNLLCQGSIDDPVPTIKIADFGLAKQINAKPPFTDYVSTRWYRAPEILLRAPDYNAPIDVFAVGAIMAQLYTMRPLFPGTSELDQIHKICQVLGTPSKVNWEHGYQLAKQIGFTFPKCLAINFSQHFPTASQDGIDLMLQMMNYDPNKRLTARECLEHKYFWVRLPIPISVGDVQEMKKNNQFNVNQETINIQQTQNLQRLREENADLFDFDLQYDQQEQKRNAMLKRQQKQVSSLKMMMNARYKPGVRVSINQIN